MRLSPRMLIRFANPGQGGPMISPITYMAGVSQMPFMFELKRSWPFRFWIYANIITFPLWCWISGQVNSPEAKKAWNEKKKSDAHKEHLAHMWKDIEGENADK